MNKFLKTVLSSIESGKITSVYSHSNIIDGINIKQDCSGFVGWALGETGKLRALAEIRSILKNNNFLKTNRFYCQDFDLLVSKQSNIQYWKFLSPPQVEQGDIFIVVFEDNNGHCGFIDSIKRISNTEFVLRIIDSTKYPHKNDSRNNGTTGIGIGDIKLSKTNSDWIYDSQNASKLPCPAKLYFVRPV